MATVLTMAQTQNHKKLLVDNAPVALQLDERWEGGHKIVVRGEFAKCGVATENNRIYPNKLWEAQIRKLDRAMEDRRVFGELDHPNDGKTQLSRVAHIITSMKIEDGRVIGEAEILDTERGKNLAALLKAGCKVGVSSRGYGSTKQNEQGEDVVQEDYKLVTFDFVAEPADSTAYPQVFFEGVEMPMTEAPTKDQDLAEKFAARVDAARRDGEVTAKESLREEFARTLIAEVAKVREEMREAVRGEMLSDPEVAGAKKALDAIKDVLRPYVLPEDFEGLVRQKDGEIKKLRTEVADRDLKIKGMEDENKKLADLARETGYKFYLERALSGDPDADLIRNALGNLAQFTTSTDLKARVTAVKEEVEKRRVEERRVEEERQRLVEEAKTTERREREIVEKKLDTISEALEESLRLNQELGLKLHAERRLTNHPKAAKIRSMIAAAQPSSKEEIDAVVENFREPVRDVEEMEEVRSRVRRLTGGGHTRVPQDEETVRPNRREVVENYNNLGAPLAELRKLAGIETEN